MKFQKIGLDELLGELGELPAEWMDPQAREVVAEVRSATQSLRELKRPISESDLASLLKEDPNFLDVCRLFLGKGQEPVAHLLCSELGEGSMTWARLRKIAAQQPGLMAHALVALGLPGTIESHLDRSWQTEDVLIERYRMSRGRAIAGQNRGRGLEDEVQTSEGGGASL